MPARFKVTDRLGNVAYIHRSPARGWCCTLANGIPASMFYAGVIEDEMGVKFALEDAADDDARERILKSRISPTYKVERA